MKKFQLRIFLLVVIALAAVMVLLYSFGPYVYEVSHGDLPCFADDSYRRHIRHMLFSFNKLMAQHGLTYWIDFGTLLGSIRRRGVIPYDHDADVCYLLKDMGRIGHHIAPKMKKKYGIDMDSFRPVQMSYQGTGVDMFVYGTYKELNRPIPEGKSNTTLTRSFYRLSDFFEQTYSDTDINDVLPTKLCPFEGELLPCPLRAQKILATRYPYTYRFNIRVPFKLKCYLNPFNLARIIFYGS